MAKRLVFVSIEAACKPSRAIATPFWKTTFSKRTSLWQITGPPFESASSLLHGPIETNVTELTAEAQKVSNDTAPAG